MKASRIGIIMVAVCVAMAGIYLIFDPAQATWMPKCTFYQITGLQCPGCGSQRAIHELLTGHFSDAWRLNPFLIVLLPVIIFLVWLEFYRETRATLYRKVHTPLNIILFGVVTIIWTIARNLF